jgi:hypothetical protein
MEDSNMSFDTIYIHRHYPIKNGYVQVPPVLETGKTSVTEAEGLSTYTGSVVNNLTLGSGKPTGSKFGAQRFLTLAPVLANNS